MSTHATYVGSSSIDGQETSQVVRDNRRRVPKGYESKDAFLKEMRELYDSGVNFNQFNMDAALDDARFFVGRQWDPNVEARRRNRNKPVLTFNKILPFVQQVLGERLINETEIRVYPDKGGSKEVAWVREGLIRSIFKNSDADLARNEAQKYQVIGGQGVYCLAIKYCGDDVFEQEIRIEAVADPYSAIFDPLAIDPTGGDAEWAFLSDEIPLAEYKKRWPKAPETSWNTPYATWNRQGYWITQDTIRIVNFWRMVEEGTKVLGLTVDGITRDVTDWTKDEYYLGRPNEEIPPIAPRPDGDLYLREVPNRFARLYICSGDQILEGPFDYPISSIPVFRVSGWEVNDGDRLNRWGLVRFIKDPQRFHNFYRSVLAEALVSAPRNKMLATPEALKGHEQRWRDAPSSDDPFLYYNDGEKPPVPVPPPPVDQSLLTESNASALDMQYISGIHEASLGMPSKEVSGKAIQQRQIVSNIGTFIFQDRLRMADERCAKLINELIPHIYDTARIVKVMGLDSKTELVAINGENQDITLGKYDVTVSVGPATITKRQLAAEQMETFVNAMPQVAPMVMDLIAEAQDWPKSDQFAKRFRMSLPPGMIPPDEMTPEMIQAQQQQQEMAQMAAELEARAKQAEITKMEAEAINQRARAQLAEAQSIQAIADAKARLKDVDSKADERDYRLLLDATDQHNKIQEEDRRFMAEREDANKESVE